MPDFEPNADLELAAAQAWEALILKEGLPQTGWSLVCLSRRDDPDIARISYIAQHPDFERYTYKFQLRPQAVAGFAAQYDMQARSYEAFQHSAQLTLPKPVFIDAQSQASVMTYIEGRPLSEFMHEAATDRQSQLALLTLAGRWLDTYHRTAVDGERPFQPQHTVVYYSGLRDQILAGTTRVAAKDLFLGGIRKIEEMAPHFANIATVSAVQHGDFHMRNLIYDGQRLSGIDISKEQSAPVGYDIAKILLDYTAIMRGAADIPKGKVVPEDVIDAFFRGYSLVGPDDPSVGLLLYARILATLIHVPQRVGERTDAKQRTLRRLRPIARNAFDL